MKSASSVEKVDSGSKWKYIERKYFATTKKLLFHMAFLCFFSMIPKALRGTFKIKAHLSYRRGRNGVKQVFGSRFIR